MLAATTTIKKAQEVEEQIQKSQRSLTKHFVNFIIKDHIPKGEHRPEHKETIAFKTNYEFCENPKQSKLFKR